MKTAIVIVVLACFLVFGDCDQPPCPCTREYRPVCGTLKVETTKTYGNECELNCAKAKKENDGVCPGDPTQAPIFPLFR